MGRRKSGATGGLAALFILCVVSLVLFTVYVREGDCAGAAGAAGAAGGAGGAGGECGPLHTVQLGAAEVLRPVRGVLSTLAQPLDGAGDKLGGVFSDEEERLRRELAEREASAAEASRLAQENARLRGLLEGQRDAYEYGPLARVIAPVGDQFTERIMLDVGTADGVGPNEPVVIGENTLVGRTTDVSRHTAKVVLVTDQEFAAGVRIVPPAEFDPASEEVPPAATAEDVPYGQGLMQTDLEDYLGVDFVPRDSRAEEGDYVVTSGRAGGRELLFPPGLYVGTVESASSQDIDQYKKIVVEPAVSPDDLEEVRVIVDW